mgnify:FL=1
MKTIRMSINEIFADSSIPIHQRYSKLVDHLVYHNPVLKTDLWNELNTLWPINADLYVEIDKDMVADALEKGINAISGSITSMSIEKESISTIIDLSTIDHIPDPLIALEEYYRVLKNSNNSDCFIISWIGDRQPEKMDNWDGMQYFFNEKEFIIKIYKAGFIIAQQGEFEGLGDELTYLKFYHLKKASNHRIYRRIRVLKYSFGIFRSYLFQKLNPLGRLRTKHYVRVDINSILSGTWNGVDKSDITSDKNGLSIEALNNDPYVVLPYIELPSGYIYIKIEITPPSRTEFQLFYNTKESDIYKEDLSVKKVIGPGRSVIGFEIPSDELVGCLRIDFGNIPGKYGFHKMDIFRVIK